MGRKEPNPGPPTLKEGKRMIQLGVKAKDKVTGFKGIITGRCQYLYGCDQYCIVPEVNKDGKAEGQWFDEGRIEIIGKGISPKDVQVEEPGGPQRDAPVPR